jgi:putative flippase GtrA
VHSNGNRMLASLRQWRWREIARWWLAGVAFLAFNLVSLYLLHGLFSLSLAWATLACAEVGTVLRFLINDRWVFGHQRPTWVRLWQFHVANAGGFAIWWSVSNLLSRFGVHYLLASVGGTACSLLFSVVTSFLWVWRKPGKRGPSRPPLPDESHQSSLDLTVG